MLPPTTILALEARACRACQGPLDPFLDLGAIQLSGYLAPEETARPCAPLVLAACSDCRLVQLLHTTPRELLFTEYWYRSGVNEVMRAELADVVLDALAAVTLEEGDVVLDTGANDGTLLSYYPDIIGLTRLAYEPAGNLQDRLRAHAEVVIPDYFPNQYDTEYQGRVKILTSIAMFYAVEELHRFLAAVSLLLHPAGVWIVQFQDLANMLVSTAFDNVCHEHLLYYSVASFNALLADYDLAITHVQHRAINGGSVRLTVQHAGQPVDPSVPQALEDEAWCQRWDSLERFAAKVATVRRQIRAAIRSRVERAQIVDLYGASTKANTLLQVCGLTGDWIRQAWERSPEKVGRRTAGTNIPIVSEDEGRADPPNALLVGIWQFRDAVIAREADFLAERGALIFPLPHVDLVSQAREVADVGA